MLSTRIRVALFFATFMFALFIPVFARLCPASAETYINNNENLPTGTQSEERELDESEITSRVIAVIIAVVVISGTVMLLLVIAPERNE